MEEKKRRDVYAEVTSRIIASLEKSVRPWVCPWERERILHPRRISGEGYRGINIILLWSAATECGYANPYWLTFLQAKELGGSVRKGEKASPVVYSGTFSNDNDKEKDEREDDRKEIPFLRSYSVFNVEQTEGLPAHYYSGKQTGEDPNEAVPAAERFVANTRATIVRGGTSAYFSLLRDEVHIPPLEAFRDSVSFYSVLLHELTHWTNKPDRSPRNFRPAAGNENYAREELVAELGAAFLCADLGLSNTVREDHAAYLSTWLEVLRRDKRAIFQAASFAQKAADYLHGLQPAAICDAA
jgi:antirestriction protein ArdC